MTLFAFIPAAAYLRTSFLPPSHHTLRRSLRVQPVTHRPCRLSTIPRASAEDLGPEQVAKNDEFIRTAQNFLVAVTGVNAAMSGVPAIAVPEGLVEVFKSKPASLAHPALMWALLATCGYTFYLGYQSRQIRSVDTEKRKELVKAKVGERHFRTSSSLFAVMTVATFTGMANTYARTGKLFPGPHLYAGLGLVTTMAIMQSFVPSIQKGKDWARQAHFSLAFVALGLFGWQAKSGMKIVGKLLGWE